jgi:hypothetical protein
VASDAFDSEVEDLEVVLAVEVDEQLVHFGELEDSGEERLLRGDLDAVARRPLFELERVDGFFFFDETEVVVLFVRPSCDLDLQSRAFGLVLAADQRDGSHLHFFGERDHQQQLRIAFCRPQRGLSELRAFVDGPEYLLAAADGSFVETPDLVNFDGFEEVVVC